MLFKTLSAAVYGIDANLIDVEVDVSGVKMNEDHFTTVGLPDTAVRESRERIRAALKNCGYDIPPTHITINLAPADLKKEGSGFDLPMALGILGAYGGLNKRELGEFVIVGELSLDGGLRPVRGALPIAVAARARKVPNLLVPEQNAREAAVVEGVKVFPMKSLLDVVRLINTGQGPEPLVVDSQALLEQVEHYRGGLQGRARPAHGQARHGSCLRRRPQHPDDRASGRRQDDAHQAHADDPSAAHL